MHPLMSTLCSLRLVIRAIIVGIWADLASTEGGKKTASYIKEKKT